MIPALSQVCSLPAPFEQIIDDYAAGKCQAVDLWMTKVEEHLQSHSTDDIRRLLAEHQVRGVSASFQGGLLDSQGEARQAAWELYQRRLALCRELEIGVLVLACDVRAPLSPQDAQRVQASSAQAARQAEQAGVKVALEFRSDAALGNNLQTAAALVAEAGSTHLGLCLDVFHFHVGPSKAEDLQLLTRDNLLLVKLSDLADVPRELARDAHRILPGEGDIPLQPLLQRLADLQYAGPVTIELLNPQLWQVPPLQFGEIGMTALRKCLGLAEK